MPIVDGARAQQTSHPTGAQDVQSVDVIRARQHARHHGPDLHTRMTAQRSQMLREQAGQARPIRQSQHRRQTRRRHQVRVIENRDDAVRSLHLKDAPLGWLVMCVVTIIIPGQRGILFLRHTPNPYPDRWIRAQNSRSTTTGA